jgi:hypothetical protein
MSIHNSVFFDNFGQLLNKYPDINLKDLFSKGQMQSKRWLVNELIKLDLDLGTIFICGGWYGSLATFLFESPLKLDKIRSFDIDNSCAPIADTFNRSWVINGWKFKATTMNILDINYPFNYKTKKYDNSEEELTEYPDTIINTSCEHIGDFKIWYENIPKETLIILQSNNFFKIEEHVNCVTDIEHFKNTAPMTHILYEGLLELDNYTRFMLIGYK